ncbi:MAG: hypothetical protein HQK88_17115 [Nitrospirae bacterium]|nr:hypothetical protein [Nitrospirota bacterium]MBF0534525.1 hypothetical protein [Nitrospirota bacterium]MBF0618522.1 hypothetical protein [Nitrospirota bacterium]
MNKSDSDLKFAYIVTLVFFVLTLFNILHHAMWRDELEAWMIARDADTLHGLVENMRYQGHPMLWHLILYPITKITRNPVAMQMVHLLIATASAFVFLRFAPFSKILRGLFIFGYYPFFEYAIISRNYALGILFLFLFCAYFGKDFKNRNYILLSTVLFFMSQCNALSAVLAIALAITLFLEPLFFKDFNAYKSGRFYASILIFTAGLAISIIQMKPPADAIFSNLVINDPGIPKKIADQITDMWNVFVPVPRIQMNFWQTNFIRYLPIRDEMMYTLRLILSSGLFLFILFTIFRKKIPAFYYVIATTGIAAFNCIFFNGYLRHKGHYYVVFVTALWLYNCYPAPKTTVNAFLSLFERNQNRFITTIFSLSIIASLMANIMGFIYPFSASKAVADYIKQNNLQNMPIAGHWYFAASGVSAYLDRPFYYPVIDKIGTFNVWKAIKYDNRNVLMQLDAYRDTVKSDILFIVNEPLSDKLIKITGIIPLRQFTQSVVKSEQFYLYLIKD